MNCKHRVSLRNRLGNSLDVQKEQSEHGLNKHHGKKTPVRTSILDEYKPFIELLVRENPEISGDKIYENLQKMGFSGKSSIVREFITKIRKEESQKAAIRFETEPAHQAQVDRIEFGKQYVNGAVQKLYAFTMVMDFSRMSFACFTTRMDNATLLNCHIKTFRFFGGIPEEILYDNMKTVWYYDGEHWQTNRQLARFAYHYGFIPKRCKIHRPETKGKVERFNQFFYQYQLPSSWNFMILYLYIFKPPILYIFNYPLIWYINSRFFMLM